MRLFVIILSLFTLVACSPANTPETIIQPTQDPTLEGTVSITAPAISSIIYSETVHLAGQASGIPANQFQVQLVGPDDSVYATSTVLVDANGKWQAEIPHGYSGEPTEITVNALPVGETLATRRYVAYSMVLAGLSYRPEGTFGSITRPVEGDTVGGDLIEVEGRGSGIYENTLLVSLITEDGAIIDNHIITLDNPNIMDDVPWKVDLTTNNYTGPAEIHIFYQSITPVDQVTLDTIKVTISNEAG